MDKIKFTIKPTSGNSLILVECEEFGAEIFKPEIINGKIQVVNIIKERRCCGGMITPLNDSTNKIQVLSIKELKKAVPIAFGKKGIQLCEDLPNYENAYFYTQRKTDNICKNNSVTFTPPYPVKINVSKEIELGNSQNLSESYNENTLNRTFIAPPQISTPSDVEFKTPQKLPYQSKRNLNESKRKSTTPKLERDIKIIKLYRKPTENTPKKPVKIVQLNSNVKNSTIYSKPKNINNKLIKSSIAATPTTVTKWRSCIKPIRTYSRFPNMQQSSIKKNSHQSNPIQSHQTIIQPFPFRSTTVGFKGSPVIKFKKITAKIDEQICISNKAFKDQLLCTSDLMKKPIFEYNTKVAFHHAKFTAFDLLTRPYKHKCIAKKLFRMFQKGCGRKFTATDPKYDILLDDIPPLTEVPRVRKRLSI